MPDNLADEAAPALTLPRPDFFQEPAKRNFYVLESDNTWLQSVFVCVGRSRIGVRHSDECRQIIMEAVEADDESKVRTFLDKNAPRRPAPQNAAPAAAPVRPLGGAPSGISGGV